MASASSCPTLEHDPLAAVEAPDRVFGTKLVPRELEARKQGLSTVQSRLVSITAKAVNCRESALVVRFTRGGEGRRKQGKDA